MTDRQTDRRMDKSIPMYRLFKEKETQKWGFYIVYHVWKTSHTGQRAWMYPGFIKVKIYRLAFIIFYNGWNNNIHWVKIRQGQIMNNEDCPLKLFLRKQRTSNVHLQQHGIIIVEWSAMSCFPTTAWSRQFLLIVQHTFSETISVLCQVIET